MVIYHFHCLTKQGAISVYRGMVRRPRVCNVLTFDKTAPFMQAIGHKQSSFYVCIIRSAASSVQAQQTTCTTFSKPVYAWVKSEPGFGINISISLQYGLMNCFSIWIAVWVCWSSINHENCGFILDSLVTLGNTPCKCAFNILSSVSECSAVI